MTKTELKAVLDKKVKVMEKAIKAVEVKEQEIADVEAQTRGELAELQEKLFQLKQEQKQTTDFKTIKKLEQGIGDVEQDITLLMKVQDKRTEALTEELGDLLVTVIKEHKDSALPAYRKYVEETILSTSILKAEEDMKVIDGYIVVLNEAVHFVQSKLLSKGLIKPNETSYKGVSVNYGVQHSRSNSVLSAFNSLKVKFGLQEVK